MAVSLITVLWIMIGFMLVIMLAGGGWAIYWWRTYRFKIELFQNIRGTKFERVKIYRGRKIRIPGSLSEEVLWVPKAKTYASAYGQMMGKNTYWMVVGQDGYWYNAVLGDFDAKLGMLDIEPVDRDVRAFHTTNQKNIQERYSAPKNWPVILMSFTIVLALIIIFAGGYFLYDKALEGQENSNQAIASAERVQQASANILEGIDNLLNGGTSSGLVRINTTK